MIEALRRVFFESKVYGIISYSGLTVVAVYSAILIISKKHIENMNLHVLILLGLIFLTVVLPVLFSYVFDTIVKKKDRGVESAVEESYGRKLKVNTLRDREGRLSKLIVLHGYEAGSIGSLFALVDKLSNPKKNLHYTVSLDGYLYDKHPIVQLTKDNDTFKKKRAVLEKVFSDRLNEGYVSLGFSKDDSGNYTEATFTSKDINLNLVSDVELSNTLGENFNVEPARWTMFSQKEDSLKMVVVNDGYSSESVEESLPSL